MLISRWVQHLDGCAWTPRLCSRCYSTSRSHCKMQIIREIVHLAQRRIVKLSGLWQYRLLSAFTMIIAHWPPLLACYFCFEDLNAVECKRSYSSVPGAITPQVFNAGFTLCVDSQPEWEFKPIQISIKWTSWSLGAPKHFVIFGNGVRCCLRIEHGWYYVIFQSEW